ncbi:hypothetical protein EVB91_029 [Rhizobium phage RHph_I1_18]|nr:hypothetical protein EVB91_029 [Rhizobium phage RHph_I1_18]
MLKEIVRPSSTTIVREALFHKCKDAKETENAFAGVDPKDVVVFSRSIDPQTFTSRIYVIIREGNKPLDMCNKFMVEQLPFELN